MGGAPKAGATLGPVGITHGHRPDGCNVWLLSFLVLEEDRPQVIGLLTIKLSIDDQLTFTARLSAGMVPAIATD